MSKKLRTPYGLPVRYSGESGTHIENEFLFGLYEQLFCNVTSKAVANYYHEARERGFPNHIHPKVPQKAISHDQLTAYSAYAYMNNLDGYVRIWALMKGLRYAGRNLHPRDYIYYNLLNKDIIGYALLPLFWLICAASLLIGFRVVGRTTYNEIYSWKKWTLQRKLSGELLWILRYESVKSEWWAQPLKWLIKLGAKLRYGNVYGLVAAYFYYDIAHPILKNWDYKL